MGLNRSNQLDLIRQAEVLQMVQYDLRRPAGRPADDYGTDMAVPSPADKLLELIGLGQDIGAALQFYLLHP